MKLLCQLLSNIEREANRCLVQPERDLSPLGCQVVALAREVARASCKRSTSFVDELVSEIVVYVWPKVESHVRAVEFQFCLEPDRTEFCAEALVRLMRTKAKFAIRDLDRSPAYRGILTDEELDARPAHWPAVEPVLTRLMLEQLLCSLPPLDRSITLLVAQGYSSDEVGERLHITSQAVRNRQCRQHKRLSEQNLYGFIF